MNIGTSRENFALTMDIPVIPLPPWRSAQRPDERRLAGDLTTKAAKVAPHHMVMGAGALEASVLPPPPTSVRGVLLTVCRPAPSEPWPHPASAISAPC